MGTLCAPSIDHLAEALVESTDQFADLLMQVHDPSLPAIGRWTIGEAANHVAGSAPHFLKAVRGEMELVGLDELDDLHERELQSDAERDPRTLAQRLREGVSGLVAHARTLDGDPMVAAFAGVEVPFSAVLAIEITEKLVHGYDVAKASKLPWRMAPGHAALALEASLPILPYALDPAGADGVAMRLELRIRKGARAVIAIERSALTVEGSSNGAVDFRLSVDPAAYLLLTFNRVSPLRAMASGQVVAWGRRPWLARRFPELMKSF